MFVNSLRRLTTASVALLLFCGSAWAAPVISNGDFSAGFTGWTVSGSPTVVTPASVGMTSPGQAAQLLSTGPTSQAQAESDFGLDAGALTPFGNLPPISGITNGTYIYQDITGDGSVAFDAIWGGGDGGYDVAVAILSDPFNLVADQIIAIGSGATGSTPQQVLTMTLGRNATALQPLRFGFFVTNTNDTIVDSSASFANIRAASSVPEIDTSTATLPVACCLIVFLGLLDRRRMATQV